MPLFLVDAGELVEVYGKDERDAAELAALEYGASEVDVLDYGSGDEIRFVASESSNKSRRRV